jgi:TPR repeat protein
MPQVPNAGNIFRRFMVISCLAAVFSGCAGQNAGLSAYNGGDYKAALEEFRKEDDASAHFALGVMYCKGQGVGKDRKKALSLFMKAALEGHVGAQYNLGLMYANGKVVKRDYRQAAHWFRMAAEEGYDKAQYNLGIMYERGDGVKRDRRKSVHWLVKSARQGNELALKTLRRRFDELRSSGALDDKSI